jgi:hypothetical protein
MMTQFDGQPLTQREVRIVRLGFLRGIQHADTTPTRSDDTATALRLFGEEGAAT